MKAAKQPGPKGPQSATVLQEPPEKPIGPQAYLLQLPPGSPPAQQAGAEPGLQALTPAEQVEMAAQRARSESGQIAGQMQPDRQTETAPVPGEHPSQDDIRQQEEMKRFEAERQRRDEEERSKATLWRGENEKVVATLRETMSSYRIQLCSEMRGALWGGGGDTRSAYMNARSSAREFEERARRAEARSLIDVKWTDFPEPEADGPIQPTRISFIRSKWKCPAVY